MQVLHADVDVELDVVDRNNKPPVWDANVYGPIHIKENVTVGTVVTSVKARFVCHDMTETRHVTCRAVPCSANSHFFKSFSLFLSFSLSLSLLRFLFLSFYFSISLSHHVSRLISISFIIHTHLYHQLHSSLRVSPRIGYVSLPLCTFWFPLCVILGSLFVTLFPIYFYYVYLHDVFYGRGSMYG